MGNAKKVGEEALKAIAELPPYYWCGHKHSAFCVEHQKYKTSKVKAGTKLWFALYDATGPEDDWKDKKKRSEKHLAEVQKMLNQKFPGLIAERSDTNAYPQSNSYFALTVVVPKSDVSNK